MPFKSDKQRKFFGAMKSNPEEAKARGIKPRVINEFLKATPAPKIKNLINPETMPHTPGSPASPEEKFSTLKRKLRSGF